MDWSDIPETIERWMYRLADETAIIKRAAVVTFNPASVYLDPESSAALVVADKADLDSYASAISALLPDRKVAASTEEKLPDLRYVKVASSSFLRNVGETLNFFPGHHFGVIPNAPSPVAAMLTTGLLGGGLGWGAGKLLEKILPERWGYNLSRTGALAGGLLGLAPGAIWAAVNAHDNKSVLDGHPFKSQSPEVYAWSGVGSSEGPEVPFNAETEGLPPLPSPYAALGESASKSGPQKNWMQKLLKFFKGGSYIPEPMQMGAQNYIEETFGRKEAVEKTAWGDNWGTMGAASGPAKSPFDVHIGALGQTLWESGAPQNLTGTTLSTMYAAQQFPDAKADPGLVTGNQLGQLAMNAGKNYLTGYAASGILNAVVGTPWTRADFGVGAAGLGLIGTVISRLFN